MRDVELLKFLTTSDAALKLKVGESEATKAGCCHKQAAPIGPCQNTHFVVRNVFENMACPSVKVALRQSVVRNCLSLSLGRAMQMTFLMVRFASAIAETMDLLSDTFARRGGMDASRYKRLVSTESYCQRVSCSHPILFRYLCEIPTFSFAKMFSQTL